jgi:hypothetical protein
MNLKSVREDFWDGISVDVRMAKVSQLDKHREDLVLLANPLNSAPPFLCGSPVSVADHTFSAAC